MNDDDLEEVDALINAFEVIRLSLLRIHSKIWLDEYFTVKEDDKRLHNLGVAYYHAVDGYGYLKQVTKDLTCG